MTTGGSPDDAARDVHASMWAWRVHEFGPPEVMQFERVPRPLPGPGEVLVGDRVGVAAGVAPVVVAEAVWSKVTP